jgi:hypothetical protein
MRRVLAGGMLVAALGGGCVVETTGTLGTNNYRPYNGALPSYTQTHTSSGWGDNAFSYRGMLTLKIRVDCPARPGGGGSLWGTDVYTDDSSMCEAGVHAGRINSAGGPVIIEIRRGFPSYAGSTRNGTTSSDYGSWDGSFVVL